MSVKFNIIYKFSRQESREFEKYFLSLYFSLYFLPKKIQSQMSVTVSLFLPYTNTVSTMVELRMARLNSLIRGLLGRLWREIKKGVPYSSAQTHSKLSSPFPLTGFLGTPLKAGTSESGKVLSYWDPR